MRGLTISPVRLISTIAPMMQITAITAAKAAIPLTQPVSALLRRSLYPLPQLSIFGGHALKIAIVGLGAVGAGIYKLFPDAVVYDEPQGLGARENVNECDVAFICVPTPRRSDGSCDTSIVESVVRWIDGPIIVIRSTVSIGTTSRLAKEHGKPIVFQPEYGPAETPDHPFNDLRKVRWIILGGDRRTCKVVARAWRDTYSSD